MRTRASSVRSAGWPRPLRRRLGPVDTWHLAASTLPPMPRLRLLGLSTSLPGSSTSLRGRDVAPMPVARSPMQAPCTSMPAPRPRSEKSTRSHATPSCARSDRRKQGRPTATRRAIHDCNHCKPPTPGRAERLQEEGPAPQLAHAKAIYNALEADKTTFPSPNPPLPALHAQIQALDAAEQATSTKTSGTAAVRDAKRDLFWTSLESERMYVQSIAGTRACCAIAIISAAAMAVGKTPTHGKPFLQAKPGAAGRRVARRQRGASRGQGPRRR